MFSEAAGCRDAWKKALEGWNVIQSQQVLEWQAQAREATMVEERRRVLVKVLERRFGPIPADLAQLIEETTNPSRLDDWLDVALSSDSVETFRDQAGAGNGP